MSPETLWYRPGHPLAWLLAPLGWLYCGIAVLRALAYRRGWLASYAVGAPVLLVGNLTVGGTGKTPLVLWLTARLRQQGWSPGVATRGYGGARSAGPRPVPPRGDPASFGDEPVLLARRAGCPVVAGRDRVAVARALVDQGCDVIVSDDGLQHYRLQRDLEILLIDGSRGYGNGRCLPAGPLREPPGRERRADLILVNGDGARDNLPRMTLVPGDAVNLADPLQRRPLRGFLGEEVTAVAGIGNPRRFFAMLRAAGLALSARPYPDHYRFRRSDLAGWPSGPILMTEKDAVKCAPLAGPGYWFVPVDAHPDEAFVTALDRAVDALRADRSRSSRGQRDD